MSSTSPAEMPERLSASPAAALASSNVVTSRSVPLRAVPIGVRAAETITASDISPPGACSWSGGDYLTPPSGQSAGAVLLRLPLRDGRTHVRGDRRVRRRWPVRAQRVLRARDPVHRLRTEREGE